jgi:dihydroxy-acid dehydratase
MLVPEDEIARRRAELLQAGGYQYPASQTPWQAIHRANVGQLGDGAILEGAEKFQRVAQKTGIPRHNH